MTPDPTRTSPPPDTPTTPPAEPGPVLAGRYRIVRPLGDGGMGSVSLARDTELDRDVAVKVIPGNRASHSDSVARFRREATALAQLSHPSIVQAFDVGEHDGRPFLVMEYVAGENLADRLKRAGPLSASRAADVGHQLALALAYAHGRGLVHRDVKPANVILTPEGRAKLLDLGLARFLQDHLADGTRTREGVGMGTPDYSAPEQFRDAHAADARSDVYALGCTLYHLIGGRVPFPGSSLSAKLEAHEGHAPTPLEELAPDTPLGLTLAVQKMMAKKPKDRFPTAKAAADALAPYVAGGANTVSEFRRTAVWDGSQIRGTTPRRPRLLPAVLGALAGVVLALAAVGAAVRSGWVQLGEPEGVTQLPQPPAPPPTPEVEVAPPPRPAAAATDDPNVLTVSQNPAAGGRYRTISAALAAVQAGQTVRVLDDGTYPEPILLSRPSQHAAVTVEAVRRATLSPTGGQAVVLIRGVPGVTVRGFRLRAEAEGLFMVAVLDSCPGVTLEELEMLPGRTTPGIGVSLEGLTVPDGAPPVVVRGCRIHRPRVGIQVRGVDRDYRTPRAAQRVVIRDNRIESPLGGINLVGDVRQVHVVGNVITGATLGGIQLENLFETTRDLLIANNTLFECDAPVRLWADKTKGVFGTGVRFRNNLTLAPNGPEVLFQHAVDADTPLGYGDGAAVAGKWDFAHNWRESDADLTAPGMIPPGKTDARRPKIDGLDRDPKSPTFLRPANDSPPATQGAGQTDPALPSYVGAVPPAGADPWDWDRAFRAPPDAQLLLVSKDPEDKAKYQTIAAALADAKPWATVRVLDAATYREGVVLTDPARYEGVTVDAPAGATLMMGPAVRRLVVVDGVPFARVRGFRLRVEGRVDGMRFVFVTGRVPGVVLDRLDIRTDTPHFCVTLGNVVVRPDEPPVTVRRCRMECPGEGVLVLGPPPGKQGPLTGVSGVAVVDNVFTRIGYRTVCVVGEVDRVLVAGNRTLDGGSSNLQLEDPGERTSRVLFANNTSVGGNSTFRVWFNSVQLPASSARAVELAGNVLAEAERVDLGVIARGESVPPAELDRLTRAWSFRQNWRDLSGSHLTERLGLAAADRKLDTAAFASRDPDSPAFLRPLGGSPLAAGGAGDLVPYLPRYAGAVPPDGVEPWDWDRTWRWTMAGPPPAPKLPETKP